MADSEEDAAVEASGPAYVPLAWAPLDANIVSGDIVCIWGSQASDVFVGLDTGGLCHLSNGIPLSGEVAPGTVVGSGWAADSQTIYATGASAWLAQGGVSSVGGLYQLGEDGFWKMTLDGTVFSVWGTSANDVYAGGPAGIMHSIDGGPFNIEASGVGSVVSVWGTASSDVYAAISGSGGGSILHSAGDGTWQTLFGPAPGVPWAIWSGRSGELYAAFAPVSSSDPTAYIVHSQPDGSWKMETVDTSFIQLVTLWGSGPSDVYAGGWHEDSSGKTGALFHSTGNGQWTAVPLPSTTYDVRAVWGSSANDVYVGAFDTEAGPVLLHGSR
jgi:hypothetical protein